MRIALYHDLPSGGAKRAAYEMVNRLAQRHTVNVFSLSTADHDFCDLRPFVNSYSITDFSPLPLLKSPLGRLNQFQRWRTLQRFDHVSQGIAGKIDEAAPDVVLVHPSMWSQAPDVLNYLKTPAAYYVHEPLRISREPVIARPYHNNRLRASLDRFDPFIRLYYRRLQTVDFRNTLKAKKLLANSRFTAANVEDVYKRHAEVCYLGVDMSCFKPLPDIERQNFVLSVGALRANKGFDFLIHALAHIAKAGRPGLRIIANADDPQERDYLAGLAHAQDVSLNIEVSVGDDHLVQRYNQAALVAYAPVREPFGLVPLEAMACGTPVVGVSEGGVGETVLDAVTGRLVPRDAALFGKVIEGILADRQLRTYYGQQGRAYVADKWGWDKSVFQIERQLEETARTGVG